MVAPAVNDLRSHLRSSVAASASPYGYTLTIFSTGAVAEHLIGKVTCNQDREAARV